MMDTLKTAGRIGALAAIGAMPGQAACAQPQRLSPRLTFEKNTGRYDSRVQYLTRAGGATIFLTDTGAVMVLPGKARGVRPEARGERRIASDRPSGPSRPSAQHVLRMDLVGAKPGKATGSGLEKQPGLVNYFIGTDPKQWRTRIPTYAKAKFAGVYPGVDVVYYGREPRAKSQEPGAGKARSLSALEYDFILHPGADPSRIRLAFEGAEKVRVVGGDLILTTPAGEVRMKRPYAYQTINGRRVQVACDYRLHSPLASRLLPAVAFKLARYDASLPLVVDPVLAFSTYLGGTDDDGSKGIAVGGDGAVYVTGHTYGSDFPTSAGAYDPSANGELDAFVMKLDSTGSNMLYGTYIGGSGWDHCNAIAVDPRVRTPSQSPSLPSPGASCPRHVRTRWLSRTAIPDLRGLDRPPSAVRIETTRTMGRHRGFDTRRGTDRSNFAQRPSPRRYSTTGASVSPCSQATTR